VFYKLLGYVVWRGAKWYLGRKAPSGRSLVAGAAGLVAAAVAAVGAKRTAGS
jgi:hypothetical protein